MKFGTRFLGYVESYQQIKWAKLSEEYGFDFCGFPHDTFLRNSWPIVSIVASETRRIELSVRASPFKINPDEIVTLLATLDEISKGRMALSLGDPVPDMLQWFGMKAEDPITKIRESVELIKRCIGSYGEKLDPYNGKEFKWSDQAYLRFKPFRKNPPICMGGRDSKFLELGAKVADGITPLIFPPEAAPLIVNRIRESCKIVGRKPETLEIIASVWISVSNNEPEKAANLLKPLVAYYGPFLEDDQLKTIGLSASDFVQIRKENERGRSDLAEELVTEDMLMLGISGSISECIERLEKLKKTGVTSISFGSPFGLDVTDAIKTIGSKIVPVIR
jgi:5,10-methylenetetrahydromethanopterin reductase